MKRIRIAVVSAGGTIEKSYDELSGVGESGQHTGYHAVVTTR